MNFQKNIHLKYQDDISHDEMLELRPIYLAPLTIKNFK